VSVRFREKKNGRRVSLLSRKKKDRRADFLRTERGIIVRSRSPGKKKRERETPHALTRRRLKKRHANAKKKKKKKKE